MNFRKDISVQKFPLSGKKMVFEKIHLRIVHFGICILENFFS